MEESLRSKNIRNQNLNSEDVIIPNDNWNETIKNYKSEKNAYHFNLSHYPGHVKHQFQKEQENSFNPITQKYTNKEEEKSIKELDKKNKINGISKGFDNELNLQSTYNIINLKNKLKGLNYSEDKYIQKKKPKNNNETNNYFFKPYNIISNNSLRIHHYLPPEQRGTIPGPETSIEGIIPIKKRKYYYNDKYIKDFDIITNRYNVFHQEKEATEKEIHSLSAAKKMQNLRTYDIIKRKFVHPVVEENYKKSIESKEKIKLDNAIKNKFKNKNYTIHNPINNEIYDQEVQKKKDEKDNLKLDKYRIKYIVEGLHRNMDINNEIKIDNQFLNIGRPTENKLINDRGYDIINLSIFNEDNKIYRHKKMKIKSDWEKLKSLADERNSTFDKKLIYKSMYDKSDVNENYKNYLIKRKIKLKELLPLKEDPIFKVSAENDKMRNRNSNFIKTFNFNNKSGNNIRSQTLDNERRGNNYIIYKFNKTNIFDKKRFYESNRNVLDYDNKDSKPILVDRNVNTRYFKNYISRFKK